MNAKKRGSTASAKNDPKAKTGAARAAKSADKTAVAAKAGDAVKAGSAARTGAAVKISAAKGRPMLTWVGKRPLAHVTAFPAQHVETFEV